jgi:hypothetical protein
MTKTHVIDGVTYVEVDRLAKSGDKIYSDWSDEIYTVEDVTEQMAVITKPGQLGHLSGFYHGTYDVLEPLKPKPTLAELVSKCTPENRPEEVFDLLANLARRVTSLETQLRSTQRNLETTAEELSNTRHRLMKYADRFAAVEDKVEMLTDDVVTLDSRSQVLNAINKYYAEGSR